MQPLRPNSRPASLLNPPYVLRSAGSAQERVLAEGAAASDPRSPVDVMNAATAAASSCTAVTADYRNFRGAVNCFNPLTFRG